MKYKIQCADGSLDYGALSSYLNGIDYDLTRIDFSSVSSEELAERLRIIQKRYIDTTAKMSFLITTSICKYHKHRKMKAIHELADKQPKKSRSTSKKK